MAANLMTHDPEFNESLFEPEDTIMRHNENNSLY